MKWFYIQYDGEGGEGMTREEAIKCIENIVPYVEENIKESLNMAIKALKQEPILGKIKEKIRAEQ